MRAIAGKEKIILVAFLWLAAIGGLLLGVTLPLLTRLGGFPALWSATSYQLEELQGNIAMFSSTQSEFEKLSANIELIRRRLLVPKDAVAFIEAIEALAKDAGLYKEMRLISEPSPAATDDLVKTSFVFSLTLVGPYEQLLRAIARLEHFTYAVDVEKLTLQPVKESQTYRAPSASGGETAAYVTAPGDVAASVVIRAHARQ